MIELVVTSQYLLGTLGMAICFLSNTTLPLYHARKKLYSFSIHPNVNIIDQLYPFNKICLTTKGVFGKARSSRKEGREAREAMEAREAT